MAAWSAGDAINTDAHNSLLGIIGYRRRNYASHLGLENVDLTYVYMSQADARTCVRTGKLTGTTHIKSNDSPAAAPASCIANGCTWFVAVRQESVTDSDIDVVAWGRAIGE